MDARVGGVPIFARHGKTLVRSLWGELAHCLGGEKALKTLGESDDSERQPDGPILILLDELVVYMATLSERGQGNLLAFLSKLTALVSRRPQTVLVVTDPADQRAYAREAAKVGETLSAAARLDDIFGRKMSDFDPIGKEAARVIAKRLFERIDPTAAQAASAAYHSLYARVVRESPGLLPPESATAAYAARLVECFPFHPRLLDTAQGRLGALQAFNKSRGTLRLFARILRNVWEGDDIELICAGDVDWSSDRIQADLLQRLNKDNFNRWKQLHARRAVPGTRGTDVAAPSGSVPGPALSRHQGAYLSGWRRTRHQPLSEGDLTRYDAPPRHTGGVHCPGRS